MISKTEGNPESDDSNRRFVFGEQTAESPLMILNLSMKSWTRWRRMTRTPFLQKNLKD
jgi:hypothetical protein